jgi:hypothetical protein
MTSIRKFGYAAMLAAVAFTFAPTSALAQQAARGHFTLTHDVRWGSAKVPAGEYAFAFDPNSTAPVLTLSKLSGPRAGFLVLVPSTAHNKGTDVSRLVFTSSPEGSYVSSMQLPDFDMTLYFATPSHASEKQLAKAAGTPSSGQ